MSLTIIRSGICDTIQDLGRRGFQHLGINPGGVMDIEAAQMAHLLVGNDIHDPILEMHFPAPVMVIEQSCVLALSGADFSPMINDNIIPMLQPIWVAAGSKLSFRQRKRGQWCYLSIQGSFAIEPWLNSYATHLKVGAGGWQGRRLSKGDQISFLRTLDNATDNADKDFKPYPWRAVPIPDPAPVDVIWFTEGPEWTRLTQESAEQICSDPFILQPASDRMGYSFQGPTLKLAVADQMVSSAVDFGTMQLLPDGQLMVLMADHQTTGGYPRVGQVISTHLPKLAQLIPGSILQWQKISYEESARLWLQQHRHLELLRYAARFNMENRTLK